MNQSGLHRKGRRAAGTLTRNAPEKCGGGTAEPGRRVRRLRVRALRVSGRIQVMVVILRLQPREWVTRVCSDPPKQA